MRHLSWTRRGALAAGAGLLGAAGCATPGAAPAGGAVAKAAFKHGVASGDPLADRVVIWTRATPETPNAAAIRLRWAVARDPGHRDVAASGEALAEAVNDFTAKVDVTGLAPGTRYWYRFYAGDAASPLGRTKTLPRPDDAVERLVIAAASCSNWPFGFFHGYRDIARRDDIDLVVHLGDYIYEYGTGGYGGQVGAKIGRNHEPAHEIVTLADYRMRHAQYKSDPDLQAAHGAHPWIATWDDHEITNNPWVAGAENHDPDLGEGAWEARKNAALRAYFEWMPVREPAPGRAREAFWRSFELGRLASLVMWETRLSGRMEQLDYTRDLPFQVFDASGGGRVAITDPVRLALLDRRNPPPGVVFEPETARFLAEILGAPGRMMMPLEAESWTLERLQESRRRGAPWQVVGSQIIFARQIGPNLKTGLSEAEKAALVARSGAAARRIEESVWGLPVNLDAWDGYPAQRDRLGDGFAALGANPVLLTGDTHCFWANELYTTKGVRCGAEFGTAGITSPGFGSSYGEMAATIQRLIADANREIVWCEATRQGYLTLTLTPSQARCDVVAVSDVTEREGDARVIKSWRARPRPEGGEFPALEEVASEA